jgi:DNA invertase Pin-like site-specific DNA recombinase
MIRTRTSAGRERAKANGIRFGRKPKLSAHQRAYALEQLDAGKSQAEVGRIVGVDQATISRLVSRATA